MSFPLKSGPGEGGDAERQSAEIIAKHPGHGEVVVCPELIDRHYGSMQGQSRDTEHTVPDDAESQESYVPRLALNYRPEV